MPFYDISIPLHASIAVWPGDTPVCVEQVARLAEGDSVNLGMITSSLHAGSHADAPFHFVETGNAIDAVPLEVYVGPVLVWDVTGLEIIAIDDIQKAPLEQASRLLLRTGGWSDHTRFPDSVPVIAADVPHYLASKGIRLLGVDVPSVDAVESKDLPNHHALAKFGIHILESLDLSGVEPGIYQLSALPIRVTGADAAPVRAVLWR